MERVIGVKAIKDFQIEVEFSDGTKGVVDLSGRLFGPVFAPLKDPEYFGKVQVDQFGAVQWPNGADLAPDAMYNALRASGRWVVGSS